MSIEEKEESYRQSTPYPFRMKPEVKESAKRESRQLDRSINWVLNQRLIKAFGLDEKRDEK